MHACMHSYINTHTFRYVCMHTRTHTHRKNTNIKPPAPCTPVPASRPPIHVVPVSWPSNHSRHVHYSHAQKTKGRARARASARPTQKRTSTQPNTHTHTHTRTHLHTYTHTHTRARARTHAATASQKHHGIHFTRPSPKQLTYIRTHNVFARYVRLCNVARV